MEKLDQSYLTDLVGKAQSGQSNAFAELYMATYQRLYAYLFYMHQDKKTAVFYLKETYVKALQQFGSLTRADLFMPWLFRTSFRLSMEHLHLTGEEKIKISDKYYTLSALINLPLSQSQILIMHDLQQLTMSEIADLLNFTGSMVKRYIRSALKHLQKNEDILRSEILQDRDVLLKRRMLKEMKLDILTNENLLKEILEENHRKLYTIPLEALASYAVYRKERFSLQRGILITALVIFLLLPLFFLLPSFQVDIEEKGERGLPVYRVHVNSLLPIGSITAKMKSHFLPVYEADRKDYAIEPIRNGDMIIKVELINKQNVEGIYSVDEVDRQCPQLVNSETTKESVILYITDEGIGIDYDEIYALSASGETVYPLSMDTDTGAVTFSYPQENWDVYIPDYIGNILHLSLTFQ